MCGRFVLFSTLDTILLSFKLKEAWKIIGGYNIAPTMSIGAIVAEGGAGERVLKPFKWGITPSWAKEDTRPIFNARGETISEKPTFSTAFSRRRCIIPADGFYEWRKDPDGKTPMFIRKLGGGLVGFAGIWEIWNGPEGPVNSCAIITCAANELMAPIHDRMPVILPADVQDVWLAPDTKVEALLPLLKPYPAGDMEAWQVGKLVNIRTADTPKLIERV